MPRAIVGKITLGSFCQCLVVNDDDTIAGLGSRFAVVQVEATPRVDVDEALQAAPAPTYLLASSGHVWTEFWGLPGPAEKFQRVEEEGKHGGGKREKMDSFVVFVLSFGVSTVQVRVEGNDSYESFAAKVAANVNIPECHWYLTFSSRDLRHMPCPSSVLHRDSTVRMQSRLLGGAPLQPTPGEWFCRACNRGGCWASRRSCFRWHRGQRTAPLRFSLSPGGAIRGKDVPWEGSVNAVPINVLLKEGHLNSNRREPQRSSNRTEAASILELLKGLNVPAETLEMASSKLNPAPPEPKPEKLLLELRIKIDALEKESDKLEGVVRTKTTELHAACQRAAVKANEVFLAKQEYDELKERTDRPREETQESAPSPVPPAVSNPADVPVDANGHEPDMDFNNPGIEEEDDGMAPSVKRKRLDHFDQMMAGLNHVDNEMLASFLAHVQAYSEQQNAIAHDVAVSSCG